MSGLTLAKLRQLKGQAGVAVPAPRPVGPDIDALRRHLRLRMPSVPALTMHSSFDRELPGDEIAAGVRLVESHLPQPAPAFAIDGRFDRRADIDAQRLLFFDTETTGLAGGSGTRAFMIGAADWHAGQLRVRQLFLTSMAGEAAMLDAFRGWTEPGSVLASYNGKCYDAPLLNTRYRLCRRCSPLPDLDHVDLLYPTRRRYRGRWENCRLATIERQALGVIREDDLPGAEAPAAWLTYLRGGSARLLRRVLAHNHQDVVTLAALLVHLSALSAVDASADAPCIPAE